MMAADIWHRLVNAWLAYPAAAILLLALALVAMLALVIVVAAQDLGRRTAAPKPCVDMDDADDYNWIDTTGRMPLDTTVQQPPVTWGRSGSNWWPKL